MENKFLYKKLEEKDFKSIVDVYENCLSEPPRNKQPRPKGRGFSCVQPTLD